jgi:Spy/CpxP family protein refolding chaperone
MSSIRNAIFAVALLSLSPIAASAQMGPGPAGGAGMMAQGEAFGPLMRLLRIANLTSDQQNQVKQIRQDSMAQLQPLFQQLRSVRSEMADKLTGTAAVTAADIAPLQQQVAQIEGNIASTMLDTILQVRALLTPDQLSRMATAHAKMKSIHAEMQALWGQGNSAPSSP